MGVIIFIFMAY